MDSGLTQHCRRPKAKYPLWRRCRAFSNEPAVNAIPFFVQLVLRMACVTPWLLMACPPPPTERNILNLYREKLPRTAAAVIALADTTHQTTRALAATAHAAAGLERSFKENPADYELAWRTARAFVTIADSLVDRNHRERFAKEASRFAKLATKIDPERPEGYYFSAASAGLVAESQLAPGKSFQEAVEKPALLLVEKSPGYEAGGGLRILGALYTKAPTWPVGVGDLDEGISLLERAVADYPTHPLNHLFLAEAYAKVNRREDAVIRLRTVLGFPPVGEWGLIGRKYREQARQMLQDLSINP